MAWHAQYRKAGRGGLDQAQIGNLGSGKAGPRGDIAMRRMTNCAVALLLASASCVPASQVEPLSRAKPRGNRPVARITSAPGERSSEPAMMAQEEARGRFVPERMDDFAWENDLARP